MNQHTPGQLRGAAAVPAMLAVVLAAFAGRPRHPSGRFVVMAQKKPDPFAPKVRQDPVTGRTEREANGPVEQAARRAGDAVENACLALPTDGSSAARYEIVRNANLHLAWLEWPGDVVVAVKMEPYATIRREWDGLDAAGRTRFAELLRARLAAMLPHSRGYGVGKRAEPNSEAA